MKSIISLGIMLKQTPSLKYLFLFLCGIIISFVIFTNPVNSSTITTFNDSSSAKNLTFTQSENKTAYVEINRYASVTDAKLNLSGFPVYNWGGKEYLANYSFVNTSTSVDSASGNPDEEPLTVDKYREWMEDSTIPVWNVTGNVSSSETMEYTIDLNSSVSEIKLSMALATGWNAYDWDWTTYNVSIYNYTGSSWKKLYDRESTFSGKNDCQVENFSITIHNDYRSGDTIKIKVEMKQHDPNEGTGYILHNATCDGEFFDLDDVPQRGSAFIWSRIYVKIVDYPSNTYIDVGNDGDTEWSHSGEFDTTERTSNFSSEINDILPACSCSGCSLDGKYCTFPLVVHSDTAGKIQLDDLNIEYTADTTPPLWNDTSGYLGSNTTSISQGDAVLLYGMGYDETGLDWAWLETNETGVWSNITESAWMEKSLSSTNFWNSHPEYIYDGQPPYPGNKTTCAFDDIISCSGTNSQLAKTNYNIPPGVRWINLTLHAYKSDASATYRVEVVNYTAGPSTYVTLGYVDTTSPTTHEFVVCDDPTTCSQYLDGNTLTIIHHQECTNLGHVYWYNCDEYTKYSARAYDMNDATTWTWSNFTWQNSSVPSGTVVGWRIYYNDTSANENVTDTKTFSINAMPETSTPIVKPDVAYTTDDLLCNATITDVENSTVGAYFKWYVNDTVNLTGYLGGIINNTNTLITTLAFGNTSKGDNWICEITPYDGTINGTAKNSSAKSIKYIYTKTSSMSFTTHEASERIEIHNRIEKDSFGINDIIKNIYSIIRKSTQVIDINLVIKRISVVFKALTESLNINEIITRIYTSTRTVIRSFDINEIITKIYGPLRTIIQTINIELIIKTLSSFYRSIIQSFSISSAIEKLRTIPNKIITQSFSINTIIPTISLFYRSLTQSVGISTLITRTTSLFKMMIESFNIQEGITSLSSFFKTTTQSFNLSTITTNIPSFHRTLNQTFGISESVERLRTVPKRITQSVGISTMTTAISSFYRMTTQSLNLSTITSELSSFYRLLTQSLNISAIIERIGAAPKTIIQSVGINTVTTRVSSLFKMRTQTLNISEITSKIFKTTRIATMGVIKLEFWDSFEDQVEWSNWNETGEGDWVIETPSTAIDVVGTYVAHSDNCITGCNLTSDPIDLSGQTDVTLKFAWGVHGIDSGEYLSLDIYDGTWHENVWSSEGGTTTYTYDFKIPRTGRQAFYAQATSVPPESGKYLTGEIISEATDTNYDEINVSDDTRWATTGSGTRYAVHYFNFTINEDVGTITELNTTWEGNAGYSTLKAKIYIWNNSLNDWQLLCEMTGDTDVSITNSTTSNIDDFVNETNGGLFFLVEHNIKTSSKYLSTDYVKVDVKTPVIDNGTETIDLDTSYNMVSDFKLRFRTKESTTSEYTEFDAVNITSVKKPYFKINDLTAKVVSSVRVLTESLNINDVVKKIYHGFKVLEQYITIGMKTIIKRVIINKFVTQSIDVSEISKKIRSVKKIIGQSFDINVIAKKVFTSLRELIQALNISTTYTTISSVLRTISQTININTITTALSSSYRYITQSLNLSTTITTISSFHRTITHSLNLPKSITTLSSSYRSLTQVLNISTIVEKIRTVSRTTTQSIGINSIITKLSSLVKTLTQILNTNMIVKRIVTLIKTLSEPLQISAFVERMGAFPTEFPVHFKVGDATTVLRKVPKILTQSVTISTIKTTVSSFYRLITQTFDINIIIESVSRFFRSFTSFFQIFTQPYRGKLHEYDSVQREPIPNITSPGSYDVKFKQIMEIDTDGETFPFTKTLPENVSNYIVYESNGVCSGTQLASGNGVSVSWNSASPAGTKENNTICYNYTDGVTASSITWSQDTDLLSNDTTQYIKGNLVITENVSEAFNITWNVTPNFLPTGSTCTENCSQTNYSADGGFTRLVKAYGPFITKTEGDRIQGDAEIMKKTNWTKQVAYTNNLTVGLRINTTASLPSCYVHADTNLTNSSNQEETIYTGSDWIEWNASIPTTGETFTIKFNTIAINVTRNETSVIQNWYRYFNVNGTCVDIEDVDCYAPIPEDRTSFTLYDNTTGAMTDVTSDSDYNVYFSDRDGDGNYDLINWTIPTLSSNTEHKFVIEGKGVTCTLISKDILNAPLHTLENVNWSEQIRCVNSAPTMISYSQKWRMLFGARSVRLDGTAKNLLYDIYGAYVMLSGSLGAGANKTHNLNYITDPVTAEWTSYFPPDLGNAYYADEDAVVEMNVSIKSWTDAQINESISKDIAIIYGKDLGVYYLNGTLYDSKSEVTGKYTLKLPNGIGASEEKKFFINFSIPTATSEKKLERPDPLTGWMIRVYSVKSVSPYILTDLHFNPDINKSQVKRVHEVTSILNVIRNLTYDSRGGDVDIELGTLEVGQEKFVMIYYDVMREPSAIVVGAQTWLFGRNIELPLISRLLARKFSVFEIIMMSSVSWVLIVVVYNSLKKYGIIKPIKIPFLRRKKEDEFELLEDLED
ncbi:MAG: hypothetical protein ACTSW1_00720 [Candidatus Hodarchaeales archaeon]